MSGPIWFLAVLAVLMGTQSAPIRDSPFDEKYFGMAMGWAIGNVIAQQKHQQQHRHLQQPTIASPQLPKPTVAVTVNVQRDAYVEFKCPIEGSPVTWDVRSGQSDGIRTRQLLIFPRMTGEVAQEYYCEVSGQVAALHVRLLDEIPVDHTDDVSDLCEHGKICPISCGDTVTWDGVAPVKERWTPLQWTTPNQIEPRFVGNGLMVADMFTSPSRMACNYVYSITEKGAAESGLSVGTELAGQKKVYNITINQPRAQIFTPFSDNSNFVVKQVCLGKPVTIRCDGLIPSVDVESVSMNWLVKTKGEPTFLPQDDLSIREEKVDSSISESPLGAGKAIELQFHPVKLEHFKRLYVCKILTTVGSTSVTVFLVGNQAIC